MSTIIKLHRFLEKEKCCQPKTQVHKDVFVFMTRTQEDHYCFKTSGSLDVRHKNYERDSNKHTIPSVIVALVFFVKLLTDMAEGSQLLTNIFQIKNE